MHAVTAGHGRDNPGHLALLHRTPDDLINPGQHGAVESL
jgi:hypothetical protein